jgi:chromosome segregation ATPase
MENVNAAKALRNFKKSIVDPIEAALEALEAGMGTQAHADEIAATIASLKAEREAATIEAAAAKKELATAKDAVAKAVVAATADAQAILDKAKEEVKAYRARQTGLIKSEVERATAKLQEQEAALKEGKAALAAKTQELAALTERIEKARAAARELLQV